MSQTDHDPYSPPAAPIGATDDAGPTAEHLEGSPWLTIWTRPRSTIRTIVDTDPTRDVFLLAAVSGFGNALAQSLQGNTAEDLTLGANVGLAAVVGPIGGIIGLYVVAGLFRKTGSWLGGRATPEEARAAVAWASLPNIVTLALIVGSLLAYGRDFLKPKEGVPPDPRLLGVLAVGLALNLWGFLLTLKGLGEVQRFSALAAFASTLLAGLIVAAVVAAVLIFGVVGGAIPLGG